MRVLILAKEDHVATAPTPEMMAEFQAFNEELVKAGAVIGDGRLYPSGQAKRLKLDGRKGMGIDGPLTETKEMGVGYLSRLARAMLWRIPMFLRAPFATATYDGGQLPSTR